MAITLIESQDTLMYVVSPSLGETTPTVANIQAGDLVGCPQTIGAIEESRNVTEYKCLSSNESIKSLGSISRGSLEIGLLFDPTDALGQDALKTAFAANDEVTIGIELSDNAGVSGTIFAFNGKVSAVSTAIEQDTAVMYTVTVEIGSAITEIAASAV